MGYSKFRFTIPRLTTKQKVYLKAGCSASVLASTLKVESRDMYEKGQWAVKPVSPSKYQTGDVLMICNRWYALPTLREKMQSFTSKLTSRSCWDDVAVVINVHNTPYMLHADYDQVRLIPMSEFVETRIPRGIALRSLVPTHPGSPLVEARSPAGKAVIDDIIQSLLSRTCAPWSFLPANWMGNYERKHFVHAVEMCLQDERVRRMQTERHTRQGMAKEERRLADLRLVVDGLADKVNFSKEKETVHPGSLVARFLASIGVLMAPTPRLSKYVPADYTANIPTLDAKLEEPRVVFRM